MKQLAKIKDKLNEDAFEVIEIMYIKNIMWFYGKKNIYFKVLVILII